MNKIRIAFIGIRGIPVIYSGFESFAELLGKKLSKKGFEVWSYNRSSYCDNSNKKYKGINLINLKTIKSKNFETLIHSFLSTVHAIFFLKPNIIYYFGVGNAMYTFLPRLFGVKTIINVNGLDWRREKWGFFGRLFLRLSERLATIFPNITITDSVFMKKYYFEKFKKEIFYIPYGFDERIKTMGKKIESKILSHYGLKKNRYFIWVGRIVPDNHLEELIYAFKKLKTDYKCVIVGDDIYKSNYKNFIFDLAKNDKRIIFTGFLPKDKYALLVRNAFCYVETKRSGGTHPSLIEAMGLVNCIVSNDCLANKQTSQNGAFYYKVREENNLLRIFKLVLTENFKKNINIKRKLKKILMKNFNWEKIISQYTHLFNYKE